jgi:hypothetical protein
MFGDESVCVSPNDQDLSVVYFAVDRVESEGNSGERVHCGNDANGDFAVGDGG